MCMEKAQAYLVLNLATDVKTSKKGFCRFVDQKRETKENVLP